MADEATGSAEFGAVPFQQAIDFFRQKVNVPSAVWADQLHGAHARAFTVAGATKEGMLVDFRSALDKAIADGTTKQDFLKDFDGIVQKYGWSYNGGRGWRANVIYSTNLTTAYAAGRYAQMTDPDLLRVRPYWRYRHADGVDHPRPEHLAWNGLTLRHDDPFWSTHFPPNGWGCHCYVETLSEGGLKKLGKSGPDKAPPIDAQPKVLNTSAGPVTIQVPKGIDPGWGYSVGEANQGKRVGEDVMDAWRKNPDRWESLTPGGWQTAGRPQSMPVDTPKAAMITPVKDVQAATAAITSAIGGSERALKLPTGDTVTIDAAALAGHIDLARSGYVPFLPELVEDPFEIWQSFERDQATGKVVIRHRILKLIGLPKSRGLMLVMQASGGRIEVLGQQPFDGHTFLSSRDPGYMQGQRRGKLLWERK